MMTVTLAVSPLAVAPLVARRPANARVAQGRRCGSAPTHRVSATAGDDGTTDRVCSEKAVSRREAVGLPATAALAAVLVSAYPTPPAHARGLPELACDAPLITSPSGLQFCDAVVGSGKEPTAKTTIKAHYTGRLENGRVFDSSYERGSPLTFRADQVIKGWGLGILGDDDVPAMKVGGKRKLIIPADLGYGARGAGGVIPGGATLYFDVELVAIL